MKSISRIIFIQLCLTLIACSPAERTTTTTNLSPPQSAQVLRFAVLGDAEPKPLAEFPHTAAAVADINRLAQQQQIHFVVGVGDIAHKGTLVQYENATPVLQQLTLPFYPIMGNEEHGSTVERFMQFANKWNDGKITLDAPSYVLEFDGVALVFASPDHGRDFNNNGINWILNQLIRLAPKPVLLVVHGAQAGVYPEMAAKGITHSDFTRVIAQPNLAAVISGDLHMDMDRVQHSKQLGKVHYLHIPALERTKVPDDTQHTAMFRVFGVYQDGIVQVDTYQTGVTSPLQRHAYQFSLMPSQK
ncbi:metallophosphoesterase [Rheinheimera baltica]|uniref:Metallophosphoesterase n=1 Tax=Rheinheimera baltica TaxID=67576 RepID=A0ABT9I1M9_9GAMM|nr:metallophosphoesterase [Rheinheimera baltica]MDP5137289.1 metallophosphoesterase [Rheinheimera baltica]MDP5141805.1 metallophosphoesterase [Rheinheimera baltica]MDP5150214.1 metallophosphoesterase [Rheinheimera baltica]